MWRRLTARNSNLLFVFFFFSNFLLSSSTSSCFTSFTLSRVSFSRSHFLRNHFGGRRLECQPRTILTGKWNLTHQGTSFWQERLRKALNYARQVFLFGRGERREREEGSGGKTLSRNGFSPRILITSSLGTSQNEKRRGGIPRIGILLRLLL